MTYEGLLVVLAGLSGHQLGFANNSSSFEPKMGEAIAQPQWKDPNPLAHGSAGDGPIQEISSPWIVREATDTRPFHTHSSVLTSSLLSGSPRTVAPLSNFPRVQP